MSMLAPTTFGQRILLLLLLPLDTQLSATISTRIVISAPVTPPSALDYHPALRVATTIMARMI